MSHDFRFYSRRYVMVLFLILSSSSRQLTLSPIEPFRGLSLSWTRLVVKSNDMLVRLWFLKNWANGIGSVKLLRIFFFFTVMWKSTKYLMDITHFVEWNGVRVLSGITIRNILPLQVPISPLNRINMKSKWFLTHNWWEPVEYSPVVSMSHLIEE